ncbi:hypothetical protein [Streptomyces sp. NPDC002133]|uniref:hypothetical protein n=1 Tax=Streptomyces sp. NPDC002133 TaxID=3154409 RepID=UPI00331C967C
MIGGVIVTPPATGGGTWNFASRTRLNPVTLTVQDRKADGMNVGVRLVTRKSNGTNHAWPWKRLHSGSGTSQSWGTSATDNGGIRLAWTQVGVFDGNTLKLMCETAEGTNLHWG